MTKKRPVSVTVFAILNLVFGCMGLLCNMCGVASLALNPMFQDMQAHQENRVGPDMQDLQKHLEANAPAYMAFQWTTLALSLILTCMLILSGIFLLWMSPFGRWAAICYCLLTILLQLGVMAYNVGFVSPTVDDWLQKQPQGVQLPSWFFAGASIAGAGLGMTYAVILLVFMLLPATARAFASSAPETLSGDAGEDYYDPDFRRQRRDLPPEG